MPADLAVIGLGHLGLPLAHAAVAAGIETIGYDTDPRPVAELAAGRSPADGSLSAAGIRRMLAGGFRPTTDPSALGRIRTAVICAPTPLGADRRPDLSAVDEAAHALAARLRPRTTVVLESAVPPGTTEGRLRAILESGSGLRAGRDFALAHSPSRLDPADRPPGCAAAPKVIGGLTPACTEAAAAFYGRITDKVVRARGLREAETVKVLETNFRHVNIALVNEMSVLCHDLGIDLWDVIRCVETKPFGFHAFRPGPGVGGHDKPLDTIGTHRPLRLVELAGRINEGMPGYVIQRCAALLNDHGKSVRGARVLLLGVTGTADLAGLEGSPAPEIAERLRELGASLCYHDPYVPDWRVQGRPVPRADFLYEAAADADLTILLQHHRTYDLQGLSVKAQLLLDTRGVSPAGAAHRL
ncbi:nucleotide sugar dehydrogenase [Streptomyces sp. SCSIO 30461]|uniref:nucleotide sugar dehydrogenase n=1 Tax=Streptomyces sp. SCSIO 30461 TaxID=3118085 RepID=UPI0030D19684